MKYSLFFFLFSFIILSCQKETTTDVKTNEDRLNYLQAPVNSEGKIIVNDTPKDYISHIEPGQHMMSVRIPNGYYSSASTLSGDELKSEIKHIISSNVNQLPYTSSSTSDVWDMCESGDQNPKNTNEVWLIYTEKGISKESHVSGSSGWNREHVWAKSHGNFGTSPGPGTDGHHLRASDAIENSNRGNLDFGDVNGPRTKNGSFYEPPLSAKGDVARSIFYMAVRYGFSVDNSSGTGARHGKLDDLLEWNEQDPVDPYEIRRNNIIYEFQNNRNPFIDHPELVKYIFGDKKDKEWVE